MSKQIISVYKAYSEEITFKNQSKDLPRYFSNEQKNLRNDVPISLKKNLIDYLTTQYLMDILRDSYLNFFLLFMEMFLWRNRQKKLQ